MPGHDERITRNFVTSFVDPLIAFVSAHAWLAYLTIFLAALLEAVPIVGSVIPGSTIILALSALVPGGELDIVGVFAAAIAGAALGRRHRILDRTSLAARNPERVADVALSERDRAKRGVLSPLGSARGILRALRAADPRLRTHHRGRARDVAAALLPDQYRGDPAVGAGAYPARRARGIGAGPGRRPRRTRRHAQNITGCRWCSAAR